MLKFFEKKRIIKNLNNSQNKAFKGTERLKKKLLFTREKNLLHKTYIRIMRF